MGQSPPDSLNIGLGCITVAIGCLVLATWQFRSGDQANAAVTGSVGLAALGGLASELRRP